MGNDFLTWLLTGKRKVTYVKDNRKKASSALEISNSFNKTYQNKKTNTSNNGNKISGSSSGGSASSGGSGGGSGSGGTTDNAVIEDVTGNAIKSQNLEPIENKFNDYTPSWVDTNDGWKQSSSRPDVHIFISYEKYEENSEQTETGEYE